MKINFNSKNFNVENTNKDNSFNDSLIHEEFNIKILEEIIRYYLNSAIITSTYSFQFYAYFENSRKDAVYLKEIFGKFNKYELN